jgi:hypothetical protein
MMVSSGVFHATESTENNSHCLTPDVRIGALLVAWVSKIIFIHPPSLTLNSTYRAFL